MNLQVVVDFSVIDESEDWMVISKPAPLIVHPANRQSEPTLLGGLEQLLAYEIQNGAKLGIVTRLDRETSGLVLVAKHTRAARELGAIFERRQATKEYLAIVRGWPEREEWENSQPIIRAGNVGFSTIWVRQIPHKDGKSCKTRFRVEERFQYGGTNYALVRCFPETGRMHQIRVHLAASGYPILGDKVYSEEGQEYLDWMAHGWNDDLEKRLILPRHALHATSLAIPWGGGEIRWNCALSPDLRQFCDGGGVLPLPDVVIWNRDA